MPGAREVRADHDRATIVMYQAYPDAIADVAVKQQRFGPPFSLGRMTWIKPSFLWLMHRSNWGRKSGQERTLAVRIRREAWHEALRLAVLTAFEPRVHGTPEKWRQAFEAAPVHVQWDPERSLRGAGLPYDSIQIGVGRTVISRYPERIPGQAPAYMLAWAVGEYTEKALGTTRAGTQVSVWHLPGEAEVATTGTLHLKGAVDFFEQRYGTYTFGRKVGSVSANWGPGAYGGMEHHPYWHVASDAMDDKLVHQHEAAHGWYGNGVRIRCWEDFVLSEGTAEYLTARSVRATEGVEAEEAVWTQWRAALARAVSRGDTLALPDSTCNEIDIISHPLWSNIPYMKGAFFYRALEKRIGAAAMDRVLAKFYRRHVGGTARMQQLLDLVQAETGYDPGPLAAVWLRGLGLPAEIP